MKKHTFALTIVLISTLILSGCTSDKQNIIEPPQSSSTSSIPNAEVKQKTNSEVKADTDKELARYRALYPDVSYSEDIVDKITPIIQKLESENKGYSEYVINFFEAYPVTITVELPEQLSVRLYNEGERQYAVLGVQPFYSSAVGICDKENNIIGGITSTTIMYPDDLVKGVDSNVIVYQGMFTGMGNTWDLGYKEISLTETGCTATTYICYPDYGLKDIYPRDYARMNNMPELGGERYFLNKAVLSYDSDKLKSASIEIDFDCISDEELLSVAKSVKFS